MKDNKLEEEFTNLLMDMLKNKKKIIESFTNYAFCRADQIIKGTKNVINSIENGNDKNLRKQLKNNMIATTELVDIVKQLCLIMTIYISSDDFSKHITKVGIKTGKPEDFIKELFNQKMKGK
jgi:hypothetical protein